MSYKKFRGNQVFSGHTFLNSTDVLVTDERGIVQDVVPEDEAGDDVQVLDGILSPGFINCHCHLELSHMKGLIPEKTGLIDFVFKVVTQRHFPEDETQAAIEKAEEEMKRNGIVAVGDICNNTSTFAQKQKRLLTYYNFVESSGWLPDLADVRFSRSKKYYDQFLLLTPGTSIVPHAPYSVSKALWQKITPYFNKKVVSIHNQETSFEDELFIQGTGDFVRMYEMMKIDNSFHIPSKKSSLQTYLERLQEAASILLVHNTFTTQPDISYAKKIAAANNQLLSFCLCANANLYIEDKLPPVDLLKASGANIVLGTDSLASNHSLSVLEEMKTIQQNFNTPLQQLLKWSTINGAKALQMENKLGSFDKGKQPGVVLLEGVTDDGNIKHANVKSVL